MADGQWPPLRATFLHKKSFGTKPKDFLCQDIHQKLAQEHRAAARERHREKSCAKPREHQAHQQRQKAGDPAACGREDGREGHHRQGHIGHIVEKGTDQAASDGLSDQRQRQCPDEERHRRHGEDIEIGSIVDVEITTAKTWSLDGKVNK